MTSDSTPAFEIEKEALKTEIETGIQAGVDHLEAKTAKRKDADKYHNTRHLLKQYLCDPNLGSRYECSNGNGAWHPPFHT